MNLDLLQYGNPWRGNLPGVAAPGLPSGFPELDAMLPDGGWPRGALTELLVSNEGVGALQLLLPALARLSQQRRWIAWVAPPYVPYRPALVAAGVDVSRLLFIHPRAGDDGLSTVEQSLRSGTCGAVLAWPMAGDGATLRRLQLAAAEGDARGVLFRPARLAEQPSPAILRLRIEQAENGLDLSLIKRRGGWAAGPVSLSMDRLLVAAGTARALC
ncbi:MAG: translesion DNA synthesis-associated protein ImuA [Thiohalobacteraceae bacterium]